MNVEYKDDDYTAFPDEREHSAWLGGYGESIQELFWEFYPRLDTMEVE